MEQFTFYREYYELITLLSEKEQQELLLAIMKYMFKDIEPDLNEKQTKIFINLIRPLQKSKIKSKCGSITKSNNNQNEIKIKSKQNQNEIKTKSNKNQNEIEMKTHQDVNVIVNVNVNVIKEIIDYLNTKISSKYSYTNNTTQRLIKARFNEGFNLEDFKLVIDKKYEEWHGTEFEKFMRPETLFSNKFESYLNQKETKGKVMDKPKWLDKEIIDTELDGTELEEFMEGL